jgi:hypothetical protein
MKFIVAKPVEEFFVIRGECFETIFSNSVTIQCRSLVSNTTYQILKAFIERCIEEKSIIIYNKEYDSVQLLHPNSGFLSIWGALYVTPSIYSNTNELAKRQYKDTESCREEYEV